MPEGFDLDSFEDESEALQAARKHISDLEKDVKGQTKRADSAEAKIAEGERTRKTDRARAVFAATGLNESLAEFFLQANPDVELTDEAVRTWAQEKGFTTPPPEPPKEDEVEQPPAAEFRPVQGAPAPTAPMPFNEWKTKYLEGDPGEKNRLLGMVDRGQVDLGRVKEFVKGDGSVGVEAKLAPTRYQE